MKKIFRIGMILMVVLALTGCAPSANQMAGTTAEGEGLAGFWLGLWHGFISFFTFVISLFNDNVGVYEVHNNGGWYNFGFVLGVSMFYGGSGSGSTRTKRIQTTKTGDINQESDTPNL